MNKPDIFLRLFKPFILIFILILITGSGCASDMKARKIIQRVDSSCDLSHLGKNKIYYSKKYKRHLSGNIRDLKRKYRK